MPSDEQDACNICDGDRSTAKNPIIFCDGKGCNMPVHKRCYNVKEIPEDDWYCQRCENKKRKKATNIICCPIQTGAVKKTENTGDYMHVVCAMWNKSIHNEVEPYQFNSSQLGLHECCFCEKNTGLCIKCDVPDCKVYFHATCAINNGIINPVAVVPSNISIKCLQHQPREIKTKASSNKKGRRLRPSRNISDSEEESEEESAEEDSEDDEEEEDEEDEEEDEEDDLTFKDRKTQKPLTPSNRSLSKSKASSVSTLVKKEVPLKRAASPHRLFREDQSSDDSDDDMGTSSKSKMSFSSSVSITKVSNNAVNANSNTSTSVSARPEEKPSHRERLEAKRKKSGLDTRPSLLEDKKPLSITPPPSSSVTPKQKLPNKTHLSSNNNNNVNNNNSSSGIRPSITPPIKKYNGPGIIKDIDEIQNDIRAGAQRWNSNTPSSSTSTVTTPLQHPQPTTPHTAATSFFETEAMKGQSHRKSMEGWKMMNGEKEELIRLREESRRFNEFKRSVTEIFQHLNVPIQGGAPPSADIEGYVNHLQVILRRVGPIREQDRVQIQDCVRGAMSGNNN